MLAVQTFPRVSPQAGTLARTLSADLCSNLPIGCAKYKREIVRQKRVYPASHALAKTSYTTSKISTADNASREGLTRPNANLSLAYRILTRI